MTADDHDRILALTSHLPHVLAVAAASCVSVDQLVFTGSGFRDTTRIAEGSPEVWTSILTDNGRHLLPAIQAAQQVLNRLSAAIETHDSDSLSMMLRQAAELRGMLRVGARTDHQ
jgi:prephenate dehydrogenase